MPVFEYLCGKCGHAFEQLLRGADEQAGVRCPKCGHARVEKQFSVFAARNAPKPAPLPAGGCGRCGDPQGPCGLGE